MTTVLYNGRFFVGSPSVVDDSGASFAQCMVFREGIITYVGSREDANIEAAERDSSTRMIDLQQRVVLPGLIDSHMHLIIFGQGLQKFDLKSCQNLDDIRKTVKEYAMANPTAPRLFGKGWMRHMSGGKGLAKSIDDLDHRPIFIDAKDLHSTWCNTAALNELNAKNISNPDGGEIVRDENGKPTGELKEGAVVLLVWPHIAKVATPDEKRVYLETAFQSYLANGYTGLVDMAMDQNAWDALQELRKASELPIRVSAYWLITPSKDEASMLAQVERAIELSQTFNKDTSPDCRVVGIKLICDGIVDACTAALTEPYSSNGANPGPIWTPEQMAPVIKKAQEGGLQIALHAIGSQTIKNALDALEEYTSPGRRHRIEHLELASSEDAIRLGKLGITASIQPVHADPAILRAWPSLLGEDRFKRAFAYKEFLDGGATLAIGTDAPTSNSNPFGNLFTATTRKSAREQDYKETVNRKFALSLATAAAAYTAGGAYSVFADDFTGALEVGKKADFAILDVDWTPEGILHGIVRQTWFEGKKAFDSSG